MAISKEQFMEKVDNTITKGKKKKGILNSIKLILTSSKLSKIEVDGMTIAEKNAYIAKKIKG